MVKIGFIYKQLTSKDFKVIYAIERGHVRYEYVPLEIIEKYARLPEEAIVLILSKLHRLKLVKRRTIAGTKAYRLTYLGLDMAALKSLVDRNVLEAIGDRIGVGKESEIFKGIAPGGKEVIIKFLRIGRTSFRQTRRTRTWAEKPTYDWFKQSKIAAEREYKALKELYYAGALVPAPIAYSRHTVVVEYIDGVELYRKPPLSNPLEVLRGILETIRKAYIDVGIVHGDLSEYNILVDKQNETPYIIDWPQYIYKEEPMADQLLERDVGYIVRFFNKNYGISLDKEKALRYVRGEDEELA